MPEQSQMVASLTQARASLIAGGMAEDSPAVKGIDAQLAQINSPEMNQRERGPTGNRYADAAIEDLFGMFMREVHMLLGSHPRTQPMIDELNRRNPPPAQG